MLQINVHHSSAIIHIEIHAGNGSYIGKLQGWIRSQFVCIITASGEGMAGSLAKPLGIDLLYTLYYLPEACTAGDLVSL